MAPMPIFTFLSFALLCGLPALAQLHPTESAQYQIFPSLRDQARIINGWREQRLNALPELMEKYNVDAWLMSQREYAEDTIWWSIKPATDFSAHRRTVVLLHTNSSSLAGAPNPLQWIDNTGDVWPELRSILVSFNPERIMVNTDRDIAFAGGLHVGVLEVLKEKLGEKWTKRFVCEPMLAVEFVGRRVGLGEDKKEKETESGSETQIAFYRHMQEETWAMIEEAFSERVVAPGITTTNDLEWWFRDKIQEQNVSTWNMPRVKVLDPSSFPGWTGSNSVINEGDVLHVDFGISMLGMHTDTQHLGYVLRTSEGETEVPEGLREGMRKANRMQDIVLEEMKPGRTGNEILKSCNERMAEEGIEGQVYSHVLSDFGHGPGTVIGFTNLPEHVPVLGELPLVPATFFSVELFARHLVPERDERLRFMLEEDAYWVEGRQRWEFVRGRQERFHLVNATATATPGPGPGPGGAGGGGGGAAAASRQGGRDPRPRVGNMGPAALEVQAVMNMMMKDVSAT